MSGFIQTLNDWGENFLSFAWPMLWQSSLLIAVVFAFDVVFARRIRAAVRYALWLAVLVKLLLPPTLALPTGAAWWLFPVKLPLVPVMKSEVVTFDAPVVLPPVSVTQTILPIPPPPPPELSGAGWVMLGNVGVGTAFLLWLAFRWWRIGARVRRAMGLDPFSADETRASRGFEVSGRISAGITRGGRAHVVRARPLANILCPFRALSQRLRRIIFNSTVQDTSDTGMSLAARIRDAGIVEALREVCQLSGLRRCPRLKLVEDVQSPAVYGLFRPVILLPRALAERLSARQLRAVLLHEAIHLRRGDVWMNCAQTLLQIAYWWHPLLWLANARTRRLREEAVDDADAYAPTLLEVAKFSFRRPLAGLALVGILESRSALRRRIERLVDFRPPRKAGLTFQALCGILVFCAVALPMGCGRQASTADSISSGADSPEKKLSTTVDPQIFIRNLKAQARWTLEQDPNEALLDIMEGEGVDCTALHEIAFNAKTGEITTQNTPEQLEIFRRVIEQLNRADGKCELPLRSTTFHRKSVLIRGQFFWMTEEDLKKITSDATYYHKQGDQAAHWTADAKHFGQIQTRIKQLGLEPFTQPRIQTGHGIAADMYIGDHTNWVDFECYPLIYDEGISLAFKAESDSVFMQDTLQKTNRYKVDGRETLDDNGGMIVRAEKADGAPTNLVLVINVKTVGETSPPTLVGETNTFSPNLWKATGPQIQASNTDVSARFSEQTESGLNQALVEERKAAHMDLTAQSDVNSSQTSSGPVINPATGLPLPAPQPNNSIDTTNALEMREFKVATNVFLATLQNETGLQIVNSDASVSAALKQFFSDKGVVLSRPKQVYYNHRLGIIFVYATPKDLDVVERVIEKMTSVSPMVHIKARFIDMPENLVADEFYHENSTGAVMCVGVMPNPDFQVVLHELERQKGVEELAQPEVTTTTGQRTQMRATTTQAALTDHIFDALPPHHVLDTKL